MAARYRRAKNKHKGPAKAAATAGPGEPTASAAHLKSDEDAATAAKGDVPPPEGGDVAGTVRRLWMDHLGSGSAEWVAWRHDPTMWIDGARRYERLGIHTIAADHYAEAMRLRDAVKARLRDRAARRARYRAAHGLPPVAGIGVVGGSGAASGSPKWGDAWTPTGGEEPTTAAASSPSPLNTVTPPKSRRSQTRPSGPRPGAKTTESVAAAPRPPLPPPTSSGGRDAPVVMHVDVAELDRQMWIGLMSCGLKAGKAALAATAAEQYVDSFESFAPPVTALAAAISPAARHGPSRRGDAADDDHALRLASVASPVRPRAPPVKVVSGVLVLLLRCGTPRVRALVEAAALQMAHQVIMPWIARGRRKLKIHQIVMATRMQRKWRAHAARKRARYLFLMKTAASTGIQAVARGMMARRRVGAIVARRLAAVRVLQRVWRSYYTRLLWHRAVMKQRAKFRDRIRWSIACCQSFIRMAPRRAQWRRTRRAAVRLQQWMRARAAVLALACSVAQRNSFVRAMRASGMRQSVVARALRNRGAGDNDGLSPWQVAYVQRHFVQWTGAALSRCNRDPEVVYTQPRWHSHGYVHREATWTRRVPGLSALVAIDHDATHGAAVRGTSGGGVSASAGAAAAAPGTGAGSTVPAALPARAARLSMIVGHRNARLSSTRAGPTIPNPIGGSVASAGGRAGGGDMTTPRRSSESSLTLSVESSAESTALASVFSAWGGVGVAGGGGSGGVSEGLTARSRRPSSAGSAAAVDMGVPFVAPALFVRAETAADAGARMRATRGAASAVINIDIDTPGGASGYYSRQRRAHSRDTGPAQASIDSGGGGIHLNLNVTVADVGNSRWLRTRAAASPPFRRAQERGRSAGVDMCTLVVALVDHAATARVQRRRDARRMRRDRRRRRAETEAALADATDEARATGGTSEARPTLFSGKQRPPLRYRHSTAVVPFRGTVATPPTATSHAQASAVPEPPSSSRLMSPPRSPLLRDSTLLQIGSRKRTITEFSGSTGSSPPRDSGGAAHADGKDVGLGGGGSGASDDNNSHSLTRIDTSQRLSSLLPSVGSALHSARASTRAAAEAARGVATYDLAARQSGPIQRAETGSSRRLSLPVDLWGSVPAVGAAHAVSSGADHFASYVSGESAEQDAAVEYSVSTARASAALERASRVDDRAHLGWGTPDPLVTMCVCWGCDCYSASSAGSDYDDSSDSEVDAITPAAEGEADAARDDGDESLKEKRVDEGYSEVGGVGIVASPAPVSPAADGASPSDDIRIGTLRLDHARAPPTPSVSPQRHNSDDARLGAGVSPPGGLMRLSVDDADDDADVTSQSGGGGKRGGGVADGSPMSQSSSNAGGGTNAQEHRRRSMTASDWAVSRVKFAAADDECNAPKLRAGRGGKQQRMYGLKLQRVAFSMLGNEADHEVLGDDGVSDHGKAWRHALATKVESLLLTAHRSHHRDCSPTSCEVLFYLTAVKEGLHDAGVPMADIRRVAMTTAERWAAAHEAKETSFAAEAKIAAIKRRRDDARIAADGGAPLRQAHDLAPTVQVGLESKGTDSMDDSAITGPSGDDDRDGEGDTQAGVPTPRPRRRSSVISVSDYGTLAVSEASASAAATVPKVSVTTIAAEKNAKLYAAAAARAKKRRAAKRRAAALARKREAAETDDTRADQVAARQQRLFRELGEDTTASDLLSSLQDAVAMMAQAEAQARTAGSDDAGASAAAAAESKALVDKAYTSLVSCLKERVMHDDWNAGGRVIECLLEVESDAGHSRGMRRTGAYYNASARRAKRQLPSPGTSVLQDITRKCWAATAGPDAAPQPLQRLKQSPRTRHWKPYGEADTTSADATGGGAASAGASSAAAAPFGNVSGARSAAEVAALSARLASAVGVPDTNPLYKQALEASVVEDNWRLAVDVCDSMSEAGATTDVDDHASIIRVCSAAPPEQRNTAMYSTLVEAGLPLAVCFAAAPRAVETNTILMGVLATAGMFEPPPVKGAVE